MNVEQGGYRYDFVYIDSSYSFIVYVDILNRLNTSLLNSGLSSLLIF